MKKRNKSGFGWFVMCCVAAVACGCEDEGASQQQQLVSGGCEAGLQACGSDCYNLKIDSSHCGDCNTICNNQVCVNGKCTDVDKACSDRTLSYCDGQCVNLQNDQNHCGDCKTVCKPNESCNEGHCEPGCAPNHKECNGKCIDITKDNDHCGDCNASCHETMYCAESQCNCQYGLYDCDNDSANGCESQTPCESKCADESLSSCGSDCFDLQNDAKHCGNCQTKCNPSQICSGGSCTESGVTCEAEDQISCWGECVGKNDVDHCGSCENTCNSDQICINGNCENKSNPSTCELPNTICYGQCVDLSSDDMNCGRCLNECNSNQKCVNSKCELQCEPRTNCNGTCIDTTSDKSHCGDCNTACRAGQTCSNSQCECDANHYNCDGDDGNGCESDTPCTCQPGETQACWRGASVVFKSEFDKSICEKGTRICDDSGQFWGPCTGGVYPSTLTCDIYGNLNGLDNDCDGIIDTICKSECDLKAGDMSYIGCEYWGAYLDNLIRTNHTFVFSNPSETDTATVYIYNKSGFEASPQAPVKTVELAPKAVQTVQMNTGATNMCLATSQNAYAYRIRSTHPITAYQFSPWGDASAHSNDASLMLPANVLGKKYIAMTWHSDTGDDHRSTLTVIATEPGTTKVDVTTTSKIIAGTGIEEMAAGNSRQFKLNRFDVLTLMAPSETTHEQTGTIIEADKNIAVYGGSRSSYVPSKAIAGCCRDHLEEQLFPLQAWGKSYIAARAYSVGTGNDFWRIMAQEDNTKVTVPESLGGPFTLNAGQFKEISTRECFTINADKPISVGQFLPSQSYNGRSIGDPSFILTVPYEQYRSDYSFMVPPSYDENFVTIIKPKDGKVFLDGTEVTQTKATSIVSSKPQTATEPFINISGTNFQVGYVSIDPGTHHMTGDKPFGLYNYGYYNMSSYGYPIGLDLRIINTN